MGLFEKIFGTYSDRALKQIKPIVEQINKLEPTMKAKSDIELKEMTNIFKDRLSKGETLDDLLPEAFAVVREAAWRVLGQRHYDVQLIGGKCKMVYMKGVKNGVELEPFAPNKKMRKFNNVHSKKIRKQQI